MFVAGETSYSWTTGIKVGGTAFLAAFAGLDTSNPVDAAAGQTVSATASVSTPAATTSAGDLLLASYYGCRDNGVGGAWSPPTGMSEIGDTSNGGSRSGSMHYAIQPSAGSTGGKAATASATQTYAIAALVPLRAAPVGPVAVTLDTNLFSSVDDA